jgi:UDPglucose 6-dehydrogenase
VSEVAVVGAGYVGLTTASCLAQLGHQVICADLDADRVRSLSAGEVPILEEGLPALVSEGLASGRLRFVVGAAEAARRA